MLGYIEAWNRLQSHHIAQNVGQQMELLGFPLGLKWQRQELSQLRSSGYPQTSCVFQSTLWKYGACHPAGDRSGNCVLLVALSRVIGSGESLLNDYNENEIKAICLDSQVVLERIQIAPFRRPCDFLPIGFEFLLPPLQPRLY